MGRPKATLAFAETTILERLVTEFSSNFDDVLVIAAPANCETFPIQDLLRRSPPFVRLMRDQNEFEGPAIALSHGLTAAVHNVAFACSCDLPLVRVDVVVALSGMLNGYEAVIPQIHGQSQPLHAVYRRNVVAHIEKQLASGERRLTCITESLNAYRPGDAELRQSDPELYSFLNVNTPEEYDRAVTIAQMLQGEDKSKA